MPSCVNCGESLKCTCKNPEQPIGQTAIQCPKLAKGKLWIHVTDDLGADVEHVLVKGKSTQSTGASGLAKFDELDPDTYPAAMMPSSDILKAYDVDKETAGERQAHVKAGVLAYVQFRLIRKAKLKVRFVVKSGAQLATETPLDANVPVSVSYNGDGAQPGNDNWTWTKDAADFKVVSAGKYTLTPTLSGLSTDEFEYLDDPKQVELLPAHNEEVVFEIARKAKLKVEIVYKGDRSYHLRDKEDGLVPITLEFLGNAFKPAGTLPDVNTKEGIAEFASLSPGKYKITPDFAKLDPCKFEYTPETREVEIFPDVDTTEIFEVEPLYQQVEFIAHCLMTIPTQVFVAAPADTHKLEITDQPNGPRTFAFKNKRVVTGRWLRTEVGLDATKAELQLMNCTILQMKEKGPNDYYTLADLDQKELAKVTNKGQIATSPVTYKAPKKPKNPNVPDVAFDATKAELKLIPSCTLEMKTKAPNDYYTLADLDQQELAKLIIGDKITDVPVIYEVKIGDKVVEQPCTVQDLAGKFWGKYHGDPDDRKDIDARVNFIKDTLDKALVQSNKHPTVLKVFMVPECFFQGLHGVYLESDVSYLVTQLQEAVQDAKWKDWVFSFGTVNSVKEAPAVAGVAFTRTIYEMKNQAPLIRGGLGVSGKPSTRMIPKLLNSAELADDLIEDANKKRTQAINEDVQFAAIPSEIEAGNLLAALLQNEQTEGSAFEAQGLPVGLWKGLVDELKVFLGKWGMARVIRQIRNARNDKVSGRSLGEWMFCAYESGMRDEQTCLPTLDEAASLLIQAQWKELYPNVPLKKPAWTDNSGNRQKVLQNISANSTVVSAACGFRFAPQETMLKTKIDELAGNDAAALTFDPSFAKSLIFQPSIFPLWKELLGKCQARQRSPAKMDLEKKELSLEDYCVVGSRKAGPWIDTLSEGKKLPPCKRMVFGLEICADHADGRLNGINTGPDEIAIDIQLVPSAGMSLKNFATRTGGYLFNCDGWNQKPSKGGKTIQVTFDGPSPYEYEDDRKRVISVSPAFPHSAVAKCDKGKATMVGDCLEPDPKKMPALSADLSKVIFGYGPGELHVYPLQPLPQ